MAFIVLRDQMIVRVEATKSYVATVPALIMLKTDMSVFVMRYAH